MPTIEKYVAKQGLDVGSTPQVNFDESPFRAAAQQGAAIAGLGQDIAQVAQHWQAREQQTEDFKAKIGFATVQQQIGQADTEAVAKMPADGSGWLEQREKAAAETLNGFVGTLPTRLQEEYKARMGLTVAGLRENYAGQELGQRTKWATDNVKTLGEGAANAVFTNPDQLEQQRFAMRDTIRSMPVDNLTKKKIEDATNESLEVARIKGLMQRDPEAAKAALGVQAGAPAQADGRAPSEDMPNGPPGSGGRARARSAIDRGANIKSYYESAHGLSPVQAAAVGGHAIQESGGQASGRVGDSGTAFGTFQWRNERFTALKRFANERGADWKDQKTQLDYAAWEGENGDAGARRAWKELKSATTVEEATKAWMHFERPQGYTPDNPAGGHGYQARLSNARSLLGKEGGGALEASAGGASGGVEPRYVLGDAPDGAKSLSYEQRLALAADIDRSARAASTQAAAQSKAQHDAWMNDFEVGIIDGKVGLDDVRQARETGLLTDADDIRKVMTRIEDRDKEVKLDAAAVEALATGVKLNPFEAENRKTADRAYTAVLSAAADPNAATQVVAENVTGRLGVAPQPYLNAIRNDLLSQSPNTVVAALQRGERLSQLSPAALERDGGGEINKNVVAFRHLVNDLGFSEDVAARRIMVANDPNARKPISREDAEKEAKKIQIGEVAGAFDQSIVPFNDPAGGFTQPQKDALVGDYRDLFRSFYEESGDAAIARAAATDQFKKLYAPTYVSGSPVVMKYPPEKNYPAIGESHAWLGEQALDAAKAASGKADLKPENLALIATPQTAAEVRQKALPSYMMGVITKDANGFQKLDILQNGVQFRFDPAAAQAKETERNKAAFEARRPVEDQRREIRQEAISGPFDPAKARKRFEANSLPQARERQAPAAEPPRLYGDDAPMGSGL